MIGAMAENDQKKISLTWLKERMLMIGKTSKQRYFNEVRYFLTPYGSNKRQGWLFSELMQTHGRRYGAMKRKIAIVLDI